MIILDKFWQNQISESELSEIFGLQRYAFSDDMNNDVYPPITFEFVSDLLILEVLIIDTSQWRNLYLIIIRLNIDLIIYFLFSSHV